MTYALEHRGLHGGFGYYGLGATMSATANDPVLQSVQRELARLGYLQQDTSIWGADGLWGPRTSSAMRSAARYVGWTAEPYTESGGRVTISDELITLLRNAQPDPSAQRSGSASAPNPTDAVNPPAVTSETPVALPLDVIAPQPSGAPGWLPAAMIGAGVLAVGGFVMWSMRKKPAAVRANRHRRRRRR